MKIKGIDIKYFFSPSRWRSVYVYVLRYLFNKISNKLSKLDLQKQSDLKEGDSILLTKELINKLNRVDDFERVWIIEQYMYRFLSCPKCLENKKCTECGCSIPERMFVRTDHCTKFYWQEFKTSEKEWNDYKTKMKFKFKLIYE